MKNKFTEAVFEKHICGLKYARFDVEYIRDVRNLCKGPGNALFQFLSAVLEGYGSSWNREGNVYLNEESVAYIIKEAKHWKETGEWLKVK